MWWQLAVEKLTALGKNVLLCFFPSSQDYLDGAVTAPKRPFCAIVGGSKVSSKITVIESLLQKVDTLIIG